MILAESIKDLFQDLQMLFVSAGVHQEVIDVDDDILQVAKYSFHKPLERGGTAKKSHGLKWSSEIDLCPEW